MVPMWIYPIALMTGNTFVWKPSCHTPGATQLQAELWKEAGLPDGVFNVVYGGREAVEAILAHPGDRGDPVRRARPRSAATSTTTGTAAGKRVGAYTGAKNAMVVLPDADPGAGRRCRRGRRASARPASGAWPRPWSSPSAAPATRSGR